MKCKAYNTFFETVGNKTRMKIVEVLYNKPLTVNEICERLNEEQSKISHNLKILTECHFLTVKQKGKNRIYSLNKKTIVPLMRLVEKHVKCYCGQTCRRTK